MATKKSKSDSKVLGTYLIPGEAGYRPHNYFFAVEDREATIAEMTVLIDYVATELDENFIIGEDGERAPFTSELVIAELEYTARLSVPLHASDTRCLVAAIGRLLAQVLEA